MNKKLWLIPAAFIVTPLGAAKGLVIEMHHIDRDGTGAAIGTVTATEGPSGSLELRLALGDLPPGAHGFHVHENPSCGPGEKDGVPQAGIAAGDHYDPAGTGRHEGPNGAGHLDDLPVLSVGPDGKAKGTVMATRLKLADLAGRALMIHAGGDNFADEPEKDGGGGARIACGAVPVAS
jgi:superoxide dismutase, Cu-Zn family